MQKKVFFFSNQYYERINNKVKYEMEIGLNLIELCLSL